MLFGPQNTHCIYLHLPLCLSDLSFLHLFPSLLLMADIYRDPAVCPVDFFRLRSHQYLAGSDRHLSSLTEIDIAI